MIHWFSTIGGIGCSGMEGPSQLRVMQEELYHIIALMAGNSWQTVL